MTAQDFVERFMGPGAVFDEGLNTVTIKVRAICPIDNEEHEFTESVELKDGNKACENLTKLREAAYHTHDLARVVAEGPYLALWEDDGDACFHCGDTSGSCTCEEVNEISAQDMLDAETNHGDRWS